MVATHKIPLIAATNNFFIFLLLITHRKRFSFLLPFLSYTYHMHVVREDFLPLLFSVEPGVF